MSINLLNAKCKWRNANLMNQATSICCLSRTLFFPLSEILYLEENFFCSVWKSADQNEVRDNISALFNSLAPHSRFSNLPLEIRKIRNYLRAYTTYSKVVS